MHVSSPRDIAVLSSATLLLAACVQQPPDYPRHVRDLRGKLPHPEFHIVVQPPFVVIGDEPPEVVERRARETVRWAVELLKRDYFPQDPDFIIDVWLFKNERSYRRHARHLFGEEPKTPFGYYSPRHRSLVMNIRTGGGTLVHEIVHPYVQANFPDCPAWFNEGLASLYEQCGERDGRIVGYTNWRLRGLQRSIRRDELPSFGILTSASEDEFYSMDRGTNYAQARYLCYFLQEEGILRRFYHEFRAAHRTDPTGIRTLQRVLEVDDMRLFQKEWEEWVLTLRFR